MNAAVHWEVYIRYCMIELDFQMTLLLNNVFLLGIQSSKIKNVQQQTTFHTIPLIFDLNRLDPPILLLQTFSTICVICVEWSIYINSLSADDWIVNWFWFKSRVEKSVCLRVEVCLEVILVVKVVCFLKLSLLGQMRDITSMHDISVIYLNVSVRDNWVLYQVV